MTKRIISVVFLMLLPFYVIVFTASASEPTRIPVLEEIALPSDLCFSVNDSCSRHQYFLQASAREDGWFAVYCRHIDSNRYSSDTFNKVYIDIYDADGRFYQELEFVSPLDLAIEIREQSINIYFYSSLLVYEFNTEELHHYTIKEGIATNEGLYSNLRKDVFVCGDWEYRCVKSHSGYSKLIRSNDDQEQVLVSMPGLTNIFLTTLVPGGIIAALASMIILRLLLKKKGKIP